MDTRRGTNEAKSAIQIQIAKKLDEIEMKENVTVLHAVESGSRAWGFESPDSDYDVRFIYVRRREDYLKLDQPRDVIEWQLDEVLDINGWDLRKALQHFHRGNATLFEWSNSPVIYKTTELWQQIYAVAEPYFSARAAVYHYYGTARNTWQQYLQEPMVRYKKYFYALRPLLAAKYIQEHLCPPPVRFDDLMKMDMPEALRTQIQYALSLKVSMGEADTRPQIPGIQAFIGSEIDRQKAWLNGAEDDHKPEWEPLDEIFLRTLELLG